MSILPVNSDGGRAMDSVDIYANTLRVGVTTWDFTLVFGQTEDLGADRIVSRDRASIRVSPQMAKHVLLSLQSAIEAYEAGFGAIPVPESTKEQTEANKKKLTQFFKQQNQTYPGS